MRIAKNTTITLTEAPTSRFLLVVDLMDEDVLLTKEGDTLLTLSLSENAVIATIAYPDGRQVTLRGEGARGREVILTAGYARMGLYVDGVLLDEDFFFTPLDYLGATVTAGSFMHFEAGYEYHSARESAIVENLTDSLDGYRPVGEAYGVRRAIPSVIGSRLHLMYLDERQGGAAKDGRGAHRVCAMFSDDGVTFHGAPVSLGIDNVREDDILDAALLRHEGRYYLYYLVKYATYTALSCAVSEDGFSYQKTGLDIEIPGVDNRRITAIAVAGGDVPHLYFVLDSMAYYAESIDLLRFSAPVSLGFSAERVFFTENTVFIAVDGQLCRVTAGVPSPIVGVPKEAVPVFYQGKWRYLGARDGAFVLFDE